VEGGLDRITPDVGPTIAIPTTAGSTAWTGRHDGSSARQSTARSVTDDYAPVTEADARWHEALARTTRNRLRIGISLGLHQPRLDQVPALGEAHARYARTIPSALAGITRAVERHDADAARAAMAEHIEEWARLNPDVDLG